MRIIGITGGVGSGKSEVLKYLEDRYRARIMEADKTGHCLLAEDESVIKAVESAFGSEVLGNNGKIDRERLGKACFSNRDKLERLNRIVHPAVRRTFREELERAKREGIRLFVIEAALLIEGGYKKELDSLWYIYCDKEIRIDRLMKNRGYSREKSLAIMGNQISEEDFKEHCDVIIDNSGEISRMQAQVDLELSGGLQDDYV